MHRASVAFACGNDGMVAASRAALVAAGVPETNIRFESFTPTGSRSA